MSYKNARDRLPCGRLRSRRRHGVPYMHKAPWLWRNLMQTRPARRRDALACRKVLLGADADSLVFELARKPHLYYW
ncbi:hypothetical protein [Methylobacterium soli]|uniref:Uncharacterized protein n=1 Tax=Methylobacterium soli TaxID=553447 RepID=A0A6L3T091_9HYPH|nr:hypothetical protein [Methylobacterium soli]KAB1078373.1 hypothetical protein F6X53_14895 [Methylobacterium soli]